MADPTEDPRLQAARIARLLLADHARNHLAKTGAASMSSGKSTEAPSEIESRCREILSIDAALTKLMSFDQRATKVVELRFFAGLTEEEIGGVLGLAQRTVHRDWESARAWLRGELIGTE
jgi:RNA polymerase sigma factor (sigma-70 family)